jgi:mycofactocin biosynthetic radical S-adenosylmethionine protein MftC
LISSSAGRNVLRLEHFGALHYARDTALFHVIEPSIARLLVEADGGHVMDAWQRRPDGLSVDELVVEAAGLQAAGVIDGDWRCTARIVRDPVATSLSAPLVTNVQITRACNLHCGHCFVDVETKRHPRELSVHQLDALFAELQAAGSPLVLLAGGEPMMRPDFFEILDAVARRDLDVALCTNATMIKDAQAERLAASAVKWFSVSLDGPNAAIHDALRGPGAFDRAVRGVRALLQAGAQGVKLRATVTSENAPHLAAFADIVRELGVPEIVFKPFRHTTSGAALTSTHLYISRAEYLRAVERAREAWPKDAPPAHFDDGMPEGLPAWTGVMPAFGCVGGTTHASVIYDGRVVSCDAVFDDADWTLHEHGFIDAWRGAPTIRAWRGLEDSGSCSACGNFTKCGGGCRARSLAAGLTMSDPDPWAYCEDEERPVKNVLLRVLH